MDSLQRLEVTPYWMRVKDTNVLLRDLPLRCPPLEYPRPEEESEAKSLIDLADRAAGILQRIVTIPGLIVHKWAWQRLFRKS